MLSKSELNFYIVYVDEKLHVIQKTLKHFANAKLQKPKLRKIKINQR